MIPVRRITISPFPSYKGTIVGAPITSQAPQLLQMTAKRRARDTQMIFAEVMGCLSITS